MTWPEPSPRYPAAERLELSEVRHGVAVGDPYRWLEDPAQPRVATWLAAQEELWAAERATWSVEEWRAAVAPLDAVDVVSPPVVRRGRSFVTRQRAGDEHPTLLVIEDGVERVLVSPGELDRSGRTALDTWRPSVEGDLLAYQLSINGTEDSRLWVMDVATGQLVDGPIDRVRRTSIGWLPGGTHYYYVRRLPPGLHPGEEAYHRRVYLHRVGADPDDDVLVFGEARGKTQFYSVDVTADGRWLRLSATTGTDPDTELWLADLASSPWHRPAWLPLQVGPARTAAHIAYGTGSTDPVWLHTTSGAPCGRIMTVTPADPGAGPRELIAERPGTVLADFAVLTGSQLHRRLGLAVWARHAVSEITVHDLESGEELSAVPLPGIGSVSNIVVERDGGHEAWFTYTDEQTPPTVLRYDGRTGVTRPGCPIGVGVRDRGVHARQVAFESHDGTTVRMFIVSPEGRPDRPRPTILTGYGGFGAVMKPSYSPEVLTWVRAGGVYAVVGLRGGGEEGEQWHRAGRREHKQNVFDDFDAATDHLVAAGWTGYDQLGILGGSNGGLLVAAALTQHPEKYAAAVCMSAVLDMVRYELSGLGPSWRPEYGSADNPDEFRVLLSYSPYHHVAPGTPYPPVLLTVAEGDTRVDALHARKMCAALQHASSGAGPVLLRYVPGVGHGVWARSQAVTVKAECLAFLAAHVGLKAPEAEA